MPFIQSTDPRWSALLKETQHDVYHLPGYCVLEAGLLLGKPIAWYSSSDNATCLIPLISRSIDFQGKYHDLVSPYGYPGILSTIILTNPEAEDILSDFHREATEQGFVTSFIRLNPLINQWRFNKSEGWHQWFHGETISVELNGSLEEIREGFAENHKRNLRRLEKMGYTVSINEWKSMGSFQAAYQQTMKRRQAPLYYFFPGHYFQILRCLLGTKLFYIAVDDPQGNFAAGGLFTLYGQVMQYHLGATTNQEVHLSPSKMMMDAAIALGIELGATILHLGGGLGGSTSDGLFRFKRGFGQNHHSFSSLRFIHRPDEYLALKPENPDHSKNIDYFPEYRYKSSQL